MTSIVEPALTYAVSVVSRWAVNGKIHIPELDCEVREINSLFVPVFQTKGYKQEKGEFVGFEVSENDAEKIWWASVRSHKAAEVIAEKIATNIFFGFKMPKTLMTIASGVLDGRRKLATAPAIKPTLMHRDTLLVGIAKRVSLEWRIPVGANLTAYINGEVPPTRGCTIAAAAMFSYDIHVNPRQANKICNRSISFERDVDQLDYLRGGQWGNINRLAHIYDQQEMIDKAILKAKSYLEKPI